MCVTTRFVPALPLRQKADLCVAQKKAIKKADEGEEKRS